ncbi:MAG: WD40 repeat domain-containing serine/threonine protein kinase [Planctomycetota bacterium]
MDPLLAKLLETGQLTPSDLAEVEREAATRGLAITDILLERDLIPPVAAARSDSLLLSDSPPPAPPQRPGSGPRPGSGSAPAPLPDEVLRALQDPRQRLARYVLLQELGRGGMGVVHRAYDPQLRREVAIKQLIPRPGEDAAVIEARVRRFELEGRAGARLRHPHIVAVHEIGVHQGRPYLVMDMVRGQSLDELLEREEVPQRRVAELLRDVADALGHAHAQGIVHRDVKPQNVLVDAQGRALLTDFGLARDLELGSGLSQTGQVLGTPLFLSPEQAAGKPQLTSPRSDVFALGGVLYYALTGEPPFLADTLLTLVKMISDDDPQPPRELSPQVSRDLETIVLKCLEKEPERRYADGAAVARELERYLSGEAIEARPQGGAERLARWTRRNPALALTSAAAALTLLVGGLYSLVRIRAERDEARRFATAAEEERRATEAARERAEAARVAVELERERAEAAARVAQAMTRRAEEERAATARQLAGSLAQKGWRLLEQAFFQDAAATFAASLRLVDNPDARSGLAQALERQRNAAVLTGYAVTRVLALPGEDSLLVGTRKGELARFQGGRYQTTYRWWQDKAVRALALAPDGTRFLAGYADGSLRAFQLETPQGDPVQELAGGHEVDVIALAFAPAGDRLASLDREGTVALWSWPAGQALGPERLPAGGTALSWSVAGLFAATAAGEVVCVEPAAPASPRGEPRWRAHTGWVGGLVEHEGDLISAGVDGRLRRFSAGGEQRAEGALGAPAVGLIRRPGRPELFVATATGTIEEWSAAGTGLRPLRTHTRARGLPRGLAVGPRCLYVVGPQRDLVTMDLEGGRGSTAQLGGDPPPAVPTATGGVVWVEPNASESATWVRSGHKPVRWQAPASIRAIAAGRKDDRAASGDAGGGVSLVVDEGARAAVRRAERAHEGPVTFVTFVNEQTLATAGGRTVRLWSAQDLRPLATHTFSDVVLDAAVSSDATRVAARVDKGIELHLPDGSERPLAGASAGPAFGGAPGAEGLWLGGGLDLYFSTPEGSTSLAYRARAQIDWIRACPRGLSLALGLRDGTLTVLELPKLRPLLRVSGQAGSPWPPTYSALGSTISTLTPGGGTNLLGLAMPRPWPVIELERTYPNTLCFVGERLLMGDHRGALSIYGREGLETKLQLHKELLSAIASDGPDRAATVGEDGLLVEVELSPPRATRRVELGEKATALAAVPEGWLVGTERGLVLVPRQGSLRRVELPGKGDLRLAATPKLVVAGRNMEDGLALLGAGFEVEARPSLGQPNQVRAAAFAPDGRAAYVGAMIHVATHEGAGARRRDGIEDLEDSAGTLWRMDRERPASPELLARLEGPVSGVAISPDGSLLATEGGAVSLFRLPEGELHATLHEHQRGVGAKAGWAVGLCNPAFSADGKLLASSLDGRRLKVWELERLGVLDTPAGAEERVAKATELRTVGLEVVRGLDPWEVAVRRAVARAQR